ncbi:hypothetical protein FRB94_002011 [Tulasnella sp. JGI-2019a]|nr:hypothetical protein FRB94_002011 [Tulasnella sp. JGI-2019a]
MSELWFFLSRFGCSGSQLRWNGDGPIHAQACTNFVQCSGRLDTRRSRSCHIYPTLTTGSLIETSPSPSNHSTPSYSTSVPLALIN